MISRPLQYAIAALVALALVLGGWAYLHHLHSTIQGLNDKVSSLKDEVAVQTDIANLAQKAAASAQTTTKVVTQTVEKVVTVKEKGDTIIKKVPVYVTKTADSQCVVTAGSVGVLNAAARNLPIVSGPAGILPDEPSGVALSTVTATAAEWASLYHQLAERYNGLVRLWNEQARTQNAK